MSSVITLWRVLPEFYEYETAGNFNLASTVSAFRRNSITVHKLNTASKTAIGINAGDMEYSSQGYVC